MVMKSSTGNNLYKHIKIITPWKSKLDICSNEGFFSSLKRENEYLEMFDVLKWYHKHP
jgi:hypothetical protein